MAFTTMTKALAATVLTYIPLVSASFDAGASDNIAVYWGMLMPLNIPSGNIH